MASLLQLNTPDAIGPIRNRGALRVCSLSGLADAGQKTFRLEQLREGLDRSIRELDNERNWEEGKNKGLLVLRFAKASCDAFINIVDDVFGKDGEVRVVGTAYGVLSSAGGAISSSIAGQKVDWLQAGADMAKKGVNGVTANKGYQIATNTLLLPREIINNAMNQNEEGLIKSVASYVWDLHATLLEIMEDEIQNPSGSKIAGVGAKVMKIGNDLFEFYQKVGEAFNELLGNEQETQERYLMFKTTLAHQARQLSKKINDLDDYISSCDTQMKSSSAAFTPSGSGAPSPSVRDTVSSSALDSTSSWATVSPVPTLK